MAAKGQRTVKPGWEHRAFLGPGPFTEDEFAEKLREHAAANGWGAAETEARASQAYEVAGDQAPANVKEE